MYDPSIHGCHGGNNTVSRFGDKAQAKGFSKGAYFVGKLAWPKGLDLLFQYMTFVKKR